MDNQDLKSRVEYLERALTELSEQFYRNNFPSQQDFTKYSNFTGRLKVPHYDTLPSVAAVGEVVESGGKFYGCSSANTWVVIGTQS